MYVGGLTRLVIGFTLKLTPEGHVNVDVPSKLKSRYVYVALNEHRYSSLSDLPVYRPPGLTKRSPTSRYCTLYESFGRGNSSSASHLEAIMQITTKLSKWSSFQTVLLFRINKIDQLYVHYANLSNVYQELITSVLFVTLYSIVSH